MQGRSSRVSFGVDRLVRIVFEVERDVVDNGLLVEGFTRVVVIVIVDKSVVVIVIGSGLLVKVGTRIVGSMIAELEDVKSKVALGKLKELIIGKLMVRFGKLDVVVMTGKLEIVVMTGKLEVVVMTGKLDVVVMTGKLDVVVMTGKLEVVVTGKLEIELEVGTLLELLCAMHTTCPICRSVHD